MKSFTLHRVPEVPWVPCCFHFYGNAISVFLFRCMRPGYEVPVSLFRCRIHSLRMIVSSSTVAHTVNCVVWRSIPTLMMSLCQFISLSPLYSGFANKMKWRPAGCWSNLLFFFQEPLNVSTKTLHSPSQPPWTRKKWRVIVLALPFRYTLSLYRAARKLGSTPVIYFLSLLLFIFVNL